MRCLAELVIHTFVTLLYLFKPGGVKTVMAENITFRQQLIVLNRKRKRPPPLTTKDRFLFGLLARFITQSRLHKIAIAVKPATILRFHKASVKRKYKLLYSNKGIKKTGRSGPSQDIVKLVIDIKQKNPLYGYRRIAMQIFQSFGVDISCFTVGRILRKHYHPIFGSDNSGPSWLTFIGNMKDSLWSVDFFKCESITLQTHTVMVIIDQFSRRIIGFAVHKGDPSGVDICRMFNSIISGKSTLPKYLSSDNDSLFIFHRWQANLRVLDIEEIKSVPYTPESHPFIERTLGSVRREFLDHTLFWNKYDLHRKLSQYKDYYNNTHGHWSLNQLTPNQQSKDPNRAIQTEDLLSHGWQSHCNGLFQTPIAA
jgi:putative transposase